jgi:hypothetical protein
MAKVTIEFDTVEEAEDVQNALDGWKWKHCVREIDEELRNTIKYDENLPTNVANAYASLRDKIQNILSDNNLKME